MSQIVLFLDDFGSSKTSAIADIRSLCNISVSDVIRAVAGKQPVLVQRLFDRTKDAFPTDLVEMLKKWKLMNFQYRAYELLDGEELNLMTIGQRYVLTVERLVNMISTRSKSLEYERALAELESGENE